MYQYVEPTEMLESKVWLSLVELYTSIKFTVSLADSKRNISNSTKSNPKSIGSFHARTTCSEVALSKVRVGVIGKDKFGAPGTCMAMILVKEIVPACDEFTGKLTV